MTKNVEMTWRCYRIRILATVPVIVIICQHLSSFYYTALDAVRLNAIFRSMIYHHFVDL